MERRRAKPIILLCADRKAIGIIEAKKSEHLSAALPNNLLSTQKAFRILWKPSCPVDCRLCTSRPEHKRSFTDYRDPGPRARDCLCVSTGLRRSAHGPLNLPLIRTRLRQMPLLITNGMRQCQIEAIHNLEASFAENHPRALIQMATGAGKNVHSGLVHLSADQTRWRSTSLVPGR